MGVLGNCWGAWKGGLKGRTSPYPFPRWVPPRGCEPLSLFNFVILNQKQVITSKIHSKFQNISDGSQLLLQVIIWMG